MSDFDHELKRRFEDEAARFVVPPVDAGRLAGRAARARVARSAASGVMALVLIFAGGSVLGGLLDKDVPTLELLQPTNRPTGATLTSSPSPSPSATVPGTGGGTATVKPDLPIGPHGLLSAPSLTPSGRFVAFFSYPSHDAFVASGPGAIFVYDRRTDRFEIASVSSAGKLVPSDAYPDISSDGRFVAFGSPGRVYVRDRTKNTTTLVSKSSAGEPANEGPATQWVSMSDDGRYVAFNGAAGNLVSGDSNGVDDVFLHDRTSKQTTRISVSSSGEQAEGASGAPRISADGRYVVFESTATNLVAGPVSACGVSTCSQIYVHARATGETTLVSKSTAGETGNNASRSAGISDDGRYVVFDSAASNLGSDAADTDGTSDVFVHDRETGKTTQLSGGQSGSDENANISGDGSLVSYSVDAFELVVHDLAAGSDRSLGSFGGGPVDFSSDNNLIAYADKESRIVLLNVATGKREIIQ